MLYFYFSFRYFSKLLLHFVTSYFYQKVQKYICIINNSQVDNQYGLWFLTDPERKRLGLEFLVNKIQQQE